MKNNKAVQVDEKNISDSEKGFYSYEKVLKITGELADAVVKNNKKKIIQIFQDRINIRSMVLLRGERNEYLNLVQTAFDLLLKSEKLELIKEDFAGIIEFLAKNKISEFILNELMVIVYHQQNLEMYVALKEVIAGNKSVFTNEKVYYWILHSIATWNEAFEHDHEKSIRNNMEVISEIRDIDRVLYLKAKFGLTYNKELLPKQKVSDFLQFSEEFMKENNLYDAFRSIVEAGRASLHLVKQLGLKENAFDTLEETKMILLKALKISKEINYPNLEIISYDVMGEFYRTRIEKVGMYIDNNGVDDYISGIRKKSKDDIKKMESYMKKGVELREQYSYKTQFSERYKRTYYDQIA